MNDIAARLVEILPSAPYRQWVFSFPFRLRVRLAYDKELLSEVLAVSIAKFFAYQRKLARRLGIAAPTAKPLAVLFVQRFGSLLQLNPHAHAALPDGVFVRDSDGQVDLVHLPPPSGRDLESLALAIVRGIVRIFARRAEEDPEPDPDDAVLLHALSAAATGELRPARPDQDVGQHTTKNHDKLAAQIHSELGVFSLHADTTVAADDRRGLERLLRYCARPAFAHKRLSLTESGKVSYRLRKPYYTGQTELVLEPGRFLRRLAALVPPRGQNQVRYDGALANRSSVRDQVAGFGLHCDSHAPPVAEVEPKPSSMEDPQPWSKTRRMAWAKLLARVFEHDVLVCPTCGGPRTIIAAITDLDVARAILDHLGLATEQPIDHGARAPPSLGLHDSIEPDHWRT